MPKHYSNETEIAAVVNGFESCTTKKEAFTHREHLTVATWYLRHSSAETALEKMRAGLQRFLKHHGVGPTKYKEDVTIAWMELIQRTLDEQDSNLSSLAAINLVLERLSDSRLVVDAQTPDKKARERQAPTRLLRPSRPPD